MIVRTRDDESILEAEPSYGPIATALIKAQPLNPFERLVFEVVRREKGEEEKRDE